MWGILSGKIHFLKGSSFHEQLALFLKNEFCTVSHGRWGVLSTWSGVFYYRYAGKKNQRGGGGISSQSGWQQTEFLPWSHMHLPSLRTGTPVGLLSVTGREGMWRKLDQQSKSDGFEAEMIYLGDPCVAKLHFRHKIQEVSGSPHLTVWNFRPPAQWQETR